MTVDEIVQAIDALSPSDRLRVIERAVHDLGAALAEPTVAPAGRAVLVEHGGLLHARGERFTALGPAEQDAHLARMATGGDLERAAFSAIRSAAMFFHYADERTWPITHGPGPLVRPRKAPEADSRVAADGEG